MALSFSIFVTVAFAQTLAPAACAQQAEPKKRSTKAFNLEIHSDSEKLIEATVVIAKKTWDVAAEIYGAKLPEEPLKAILYRDIAGYEAAEQKLTQGRFKRNLAFAHYKTNSAHVALQPPLSDEGLADVGMPTLTARWFLRAQSCSSVSFAQPASVLRP